VDLLGCQSTPTDISGRKLAIFDSPSKAEDLNSNTTKSGLFDNVRLSAFSSVIEDFCALAD
jgi:hypothetical protein